MVRSNVVNADSVNALQSMSLVPRLNYSNDLLSKIIQILKKKKTLTKRSTQMILQDCDSTEKACQEAIDTEKILSLSIEILTQIQKRSNMVSNVTSIPEIMPSAIPMIRTISANLHQVSPKSSLMLSELSVHLGSIIVDSAAICKAKFDFSELNAQSAILVDEVKLIVDSKIDKQYSNLETSKA